MLEFIIFGIVDNAVMIVGALFGLEVENWLPGRFKRGLGAVVGAGIGNALSDFLGGLMAFNMNLAIGSGIGCLLALILIPILYMLKK